MIPLTIADDIQTTLLDYLTTTFNLQVIIPIKARYLEFEGKEKSPSYLEIAWRFTPPDSEADYHQAWAHFEERLKDEE